MHIIGIIVAVIGGILFVLWRMQQAANATRDIAEAAGEVQGLFRRWQWSRKASKHPLETVTDPKEAAAAMLVAVAQADGPLTEAESTVIRTRMSSVFGASRTEAEELLARGRWLTKDSVDAGNVFRRVLPVVQKSLGPAERRELIEMLKVTASANGVADHTSAADIERLAQQLQS